MTRFPKRPALLLPLACALLPCALRAQEPATDDTGADVPPAATVPASMQSALTRYQIALDQIASGRALEARVVLEDLVARSGDRPEWNVLLASLLEREGKASQARRVLAKVQASPLALAYLARLQNVPDGPGAEGASAQRIEAPTREDVATPEERASNNPARSPSADARLARLEKEMLAMVNRERAARGLRELQWNSDLAEVARAHSVEMRQKKYFAHESPTASLKQPMNRYVAGMGKAPRIVAENIYRAWGTQHQLGRADIEAGHTSLMNSPGHRSNILLAQAERCGIGIAVNENGDIWLTQMFDRP